jgi:hypothetical protein
MDPRTRHLSATRGARAPVRPASIEEVGGPVGAGDSTTVQDAEEQAQALRARRVGPEIAGAYSAGGFDAVKQTKDWYDLPAWQRTQILASAMGSN